MGEKGGVGAFIFLFSVELGTYLCPYASYEPGLSSLQPFVLWLRPESEGSCHSYV